MHGVVGDLQWDLNWDDDVVGRVKPCRVGFGHVLTDGLEVLWW